MENKTESRPIKKNGYSRAKINVYLNTKRTEAKARQAKYDKLSKAQKVELAKSRRGESKRELDKLV